MKMPSLARCLAALVCAAPPAVPAQPASPAWPARLIRIVVPFPPAGPTDIQARWAGQQLNAALGQPVII